MLRRVSWMPCMGKIALWSLPKQTMGSALGRWKGSWRVCGSLPPVWRVRRTLRSPEAFPFIVQHIGYFEGHCRKGLDNGAVRL
jgi:hypothetical protein